MDGEMREDARRALEVIERVLAQRSAEKEFEQVAECNRRIVQLRDHLIARLRTDGPGNGVRENLDRVNVLLSMAASAEYPLQGIHWERMQKTRDLLADMARG